MDITTIAGLVLAVVAILLGQMLEGGHASSLVQATAGIIVVGGTIGATMVGLPLKDFMRGVKMLGKGFTNTKHDFEGQVKELVELATAARRDGVLSLEGKLASVKDPFMRRGLQLLIDGVDASVVRDTLEAEIDLEHEEATVGTKVFESAGGYSPTIGILGAVLGLIHVMENLDDPSKLGPGIAVAFVATVYGVALANIFLLPMANKLKRKLALERDRKTLMAEGLLGIQNGLNPRVLEEKLGVFTRAHGHAPPKPAGQEAPKA